MLIAADTHVHIYPCHDAALALRTALDHLAAHRADARVMALTERHDCSFFRDVRAGRRVPGWTVEPCAEPEAVTARAGDGATLYVIAGRQVVTRERIEILALTTDATIADGQPADDVLKAVRDAGGLPVLAWAPGKWFFARGRLIARLLEDAVPGTLLIGDSTLRPTIWPTPDLMSFGHARGLRIVAGSDPLPYAGEEKYAGLFASLFDGPFDEARPVASFRRLLTDPAVQSLEVGRRCVLMEMVRRLRKNRAERAL